MFTRTTKTIAIIALTTFCLTQAGLAAPFKAQNLRQKNEGEAGAAGRKELVVALAQPGQPVLAAVKVDAAGMTKDAFVKKWTELRKQRYMYGTIVKTDGSRIEGVRLDLLQYTLMEHVLWETHGEQPHTSLRYDEISSLESAPAQAPAGDTPAAEISAFVEVHDELKNLGKNDRILIYGKSGEVFLQKEGHIGPDIKVADNALPDVRGAMVKAGIEVLSVYSKAWDRENLAALEYALDHLGVVRQYLVPSIGSANRTVIQTTAEHGNLNITLASPITLTSGTDVNRLSSHIAINTSRGDSPPAVLTSSAHDGIRYEQLEVTTLGAQRVSLEKLIADADARQRAQDTEVTSYGDAIGRVGRLEAAVDFEGEIGAVTLITMPYKKDGNTMAEYEDEIGKMLVWIEGRLGITPYKYPQGFNWQTANDNHNRILRAMRELAGFYSENAISIEEIRARLEPMLAAVTAAPAEPEVALGLPGKYTNAEELIRFASYIRENKRFPSELNHLSTSLDVALAILNPDENISNAAIALIRTIDEINPIYGYTNTANYTNWVRRSAINEFNDRVVGYPKAPLRPLAVPADNKKGFMISPELTKTTDAGILVSQIQGAKGVFFVNTYDEMNEFTQVLDLSQTRSQILIISLEGYNGDLYAAMKHAAEWLGKDGIINDVTYYHSEDEAALAESQTFGAVTVTDYSVERSQINDLWRKILGDINTAGLENLKEEQIKDLKRLARAALNAV